MDPMLVYDIVSGAALVVSVLIDVRLALALWRRVRS